MDANKGVIFTGLGFELAALIIGATFLGQKIDKAWAWNGYATVSLILIFFISWLVHLIVLLKKFSEDDSDPG